MEYIFATDSNLICQLFNFLLGPETGFICFQVCGWETIFYGYACMTGLCFLIVVVTLINKILFILSLKGRASKTTLILIKLRLVFYL